MLTFNEDKEMTKQELAEKLVGIYTNDDTIITASLGIFTFTYGEYAVDKYTPAELMESAHSIDPTVKTRYAAELNAAFAMYRYFKDHPSLFALGRKAFLAHNDSEMCKAHQLIIYGAPGTGKSWRIKKDTKGCEVIRTTFHPDSDYSTFVGAYKPSMEADKYDTVVTTGEKNAAGAISKKDGLVRQKRIVYKFVAQAFLEAYVAAWRKCAAFLAAQTDEAKTAAEQFLVIEEINRGNCAQIFGDIFQLLDREDDGYSSYAIKSDTDLCQFLSEAFEEDADKGIAALDLAGVNLGDRDVTPDEIKTGKKMLLPPNMFIWATMNTSDQSLFPIDSAFKRRWDWEYVPIAKPDKSDDPDWKERKIEVGDSLFDWWEFLTAINGHIAKATESEDKQLGYFFVKADDATGYISAEQFANKVLFYLYGDVFKSYDLPKENCFKVGNEVLKFHDFFYSEKTEIEQSDGTKVAKKPGDVKLDVVAGFLKGLKWKEIVVTCEQKPVAAAATASETVATQGESTSGDDNAAATSGQ